MGKKKGRNSKERKLCWFEFGFLTGTTLNGLFSALDIHGDLMIRKEEKRLRLYGKKVMRVLISSSICYGINQNCAKRKGLIASTMYVKT